MRPVSGGFRESDSVPSACLAPRIAHLCHPRCRQAPPRVKSRLRGSPPRTRAESGRALALSPRSSCARSSVPVGLRRLVCLVCSPGATYHRVRLLLRLFTLGKINSGTSGRVCSWPSYSVYPHCIQLACQPESSLLTHTSPPHLGQLLRIHVPMSHHDLVWFRAVRSAPAQQPQITIIPSQVADLYGVLPA